MNEAQAKVVWDYARQQVSLGLGRFGAPNEARCISNWVQVPKPDGTIRPCGGFVQINGMTQLDRFFVPNIEDVFARLKDHRIFFTTDVEAAFQAIPATEEAQKLMALWMPDGSVFFPGTMMFGMNNAPPVFHRNIEVALQGISDAASYVDDVHGGGVDWASKLLTLRDTCEALHQHGFYLAFRKTHLGADVPLLGYRRTAAGLIADPKRIDAEIQSLPSPTNKTELRSQIAMMRWFSPFIQGDSSVQGLGEALGHFDSLTSAKTPWRWSDDDEKRWRQVLALLARQIALARPDSQRIFIWRQMRQSQDGVTWLISLLTVARNAFCVSVPSHSKAPWRMQPRFIKRLMLW